MNNILTTEGLIINAKKIWWIKINTKAIRTGPLDEATFPYLLKIKYTINNITYERNKIVYPNLFNINDKVTITYKKENPKKILKITKRA